ncbi:MAG: tRNA (adenosine(37)-N6)-threonylcarbamoyltransferase complex ATPase subunit type 1 TsaE [Verrucomicrobiota bacterium]|nr:tRNA (adenosine(37)-N6)-threonylcarbamoyltransferase complex ATPase subunit type 1 TsaE [Verrucomicrobiota bacterium]
MFTSNSAAETQAAGARAADDVHAGTVFALVGDLGAGKTQFVKGLVRQIGSENEVTSPTFTLLHEYRGGRLPVYHFDFYRIDSAEAALRLGLDEYLYGDGVCVIEWADRFRELLPPTARWFSMTPTGETSREIEEQISDEDSRF